MPDRWSLVVDSWAVEFEYRSDEGPLLVGPFPSKLAAQDYIDSLSGVVAEFAADTPRLARPMRHSDGPGGAQ